MLNNQGYYNFNCQYFASVTVIMEYRHDIVIRATAVKGAHKNLNIKTEHATLKN